jgi:hemoglobin/transferrin/lactoferrin receptor protein
MVRREFLFNGQPTIVYQDEESQVYAMVNAGYAIVYGTQLKAELRPSSFIRVKSSLTLTGGHDNDDEPLRHVPPLFGATHAIFEKADLKADVYAVYNGCITYERLALSEKDKPYLYAEDSGGNPWSPGWFTLNFKVSYNLGNRLDLTAGIENILDLRYRPYSSGIAAPGRNFLVSARVRI